MTTMTVSSAATAGPTPTAAYASSNLAPGVELVASSPVTEAQLYYWSARWQADQAETLAELDAGHSVEFDSADDAIRWLLSADA